MMRYLTLCAAFIIGVPCLLNTVVAQETKSESQADEYKVLFDGSSLDRLRGYKQEEIGAGWSIDGDALYFDGTGGGDIITKEEFGNFELHFEWKVAEGANSGVMCRVSLGDHSPYVSGAEYQILDDAGHGDGKNEMTSAASLYGMCAPEGKELKKVGEWNSAKIVMNGNLLEHWLNGKKVVSIEQGSDEWKTRLGKSKFKTWEKFAKNDEGHIAFQDHGDKVWFRKIKIKELDQK